MVESEIETAVFNFENGRPFRMTLGVKTCLRGFECGQFPNGAVTKLRGFASPPSSMQSQSNGSHWHSKKVSG